MYSMYKKALKLLLNYEILHTTLGTYYETDF